RRHGQGDHDWQARSTTGDARSLYRERRRQGHARGSGRRCNQRRSPEGGARHSGEDGWPDGRDELAAGHEAAVLMIYPAALVQLIEALRRLPGVGPKSAQRMAFHLLEKDRSGAQTLADALQKATAGVGRCERCRMFADAQLCPICASAARDRSMLCVVESPADVAAIEQSGGYRGVYFVLMGHLSPLDGVGP